MQCRAASIYGLWQIARLGNAKARCLVEVAKRTASLARFLAASCTVSAACSFSLRPFTTFHSSRAVLTQACRVTEAQGGWSFLTRGSGTARLWH